MSEINKMLSETEILEVIEKHFEDIPIKAWASYGNLCLFRVKYPKSEEEENYDPLFSVDKMTGEVRDFSVFTDGNISDIAQLEWKEL